MSEKIKLSLEEVKYLHDELGSRFFKLQSEMAKDRGDKVIDLYYKSIDFIHKTVTIIGIIAGFGFTALGYVKNIKSFITGEILLFSSIIFGLIVTQFIYLNEINTFENFFTKVRKNFKERNDLFRTVSEKSIKNVLEQDDLRQLLKKDEEMIGILEHKEKKGKDTGRFSVTPVIIVNIILFILMTLGGVLIFTSLI